MLEEEEKAVQKWMENQKEKSKGKGDQGMPKDTTWIKIRMTRRIKIKENQKENQRRVGSDAWV